MSGYVSLDLVRQNYHTDTEREINTQINLELKAFYSYLSMVSSVCVCNSLVYSCLLNYSFSLSTLTELMSLSPTSQNTSRSALMRSMNTPKSS